jgi:SCF-associated factor 1
VTTPIRLKIPTPIVDLVAGGWSFHALDVTGRIHHWGTLDGSISTRDSSRPDTPLSNRYKVVARPQTLAVDLPPIKSVAAGRAHAVALDVRGRDVFEIWSWGRIARLSLPSEIGSKGVKQISAGWQFSALLSGKGEAWIWWKASDPEENRKSDEAGEGLPGVRAVVWNREQANLLRLPDLPPPKEGEEPGEMVRIDCGDNFVVRLTYLTLVFPCMSPRANGRTDQVALTSLGRVYKLDVSPPADDDGDYDDEYVEEDDAAGITVRDRARLEAQLLSGQRRWIYLDRFSERRITHISAHFQHFVAYDPSSKEGGAVLIGKQAFDEHSQPIVEEELQGKGVIKCVIREPLWSRRTDLTDAS